MLNCATMETGNSRTIRVLKNRIIVLWVFGIMGGLFFGALQVELWIHQLGLVAELDGETEPVVVAIEQG